MSVSALVAGDRYTVSAFYVKPLSLITCSVNTTFLLTNEICQHERDLIVALSFCLPADSLPNFNPRLSREHLALAQENGVA